jgi:hypothetical protein
MAMIAMTTRSSISVKPFAGAKSLSATAGRSSLPLASTFMLKNQLQAREPAPLLHKTMAFLVGGTDPAQISK